MNDESSTLAGFPIVRPIQASCISFLATNLCSRLETTCAVDLRCWLVGSVRIWMTVLMVLALFLPSLPYQCRFTNWPDLPNEQFPK